MYTSGVRPVNTTSTRWNDQKLQAMDHLIEKFRLCCVISSTTNNSKEKATLEGKFNKLIDAKVLLYCALFTDILAEANKFNLITQKSDINIIDILDLVESNKNNYECLFRKLCKNYDLVFLLPTLNLIDAVESNNEDGDVLHQDQNVNYYLCEKNKYSIMSLKWYCFKKRYGNLHSSETEAEVNVNSDHGGCILFEMCHILNCNFWPKPTSNVEPYVVQLNPF